MKKHKCGLCNKIFFTKKSVNRKFCSLICKYKNHSFLMKNNKLSLLRKSFKLSKQVKKKLSKSIKKLWSSGHYENIKHWITQLRFQGKNHPNYKGGRKRDLIYSTLFTKKIKNLIFKRDHYICKLCKKQGGVLHCHHIDYNKFNTSLENLVTLCNSCHARTNYNRKYWQKILKYKHKQYSLVIGRFQVSKPHLGHETLIRTLLKEGKNVYIALRPSFFDEKNPYDFYERREMFEKLFEKEILEGKVLVVPLDVDISEIVYGRGVGYNIRQIRLEEKLEKISGTETRKQMKRNENRNSKV